LLYYNKAESEFNLKKYESAIQDYTKSIQLYLLTIDNSSINIEVEEYIKNGSKKMELKDYIGAIEDFNAAIEIDSNNIVLFCKKRIAEIKFKNK
jgi:tetratricopeptide (TPR) repeat protein